MWIILEPVIFALIGTEIQIDKIDPSTIGFGTIVLVGALLIRYGCSLLCFSPKILAVGVKSDTNNIQTNDLVC